MEGGVKRIAPLIDQLKRLCRGHMSTDHGSAAGDMLAYLRLAWPEVSTITLTSDQNERRDADELALEIIRDVGEVASILLEEDPSERLAWARANLMLDLERYVLAARER
jgi:hypothetical protein